MRKQTPPKPPRGVFRSINPVVVPQEVLRKTPEITSNPLVCKFKGLEKRQQLIEQFQSKLGIRRTDEEFTGRDGMDTMIEVILANSLDEASNSNARDRAVKLLDLWLQESIIRPRDQEWSHEFQDDKKVLYVFNPPEMFKVVMTPRARSSSCERRPSRRGSFKSLFKFSTNENVEPRHRLFGYDEEKVENTRLFHERNKEKETNTVTAEIELKDEAQIFESALRCLLLEVEVPVLDDVLAVKDCSGEESVSFLSSILRRMGFGAEQKMTSIDDVEKFIRECPHLKRTHSQVIEWFRAALRCAPSMHLIKQSGLSNHSQIYEWIKMALKAVVNNLTAITSNYNHPLIPAEFAPFIKAITEQLCLRTVSTAKRDKVLHLLWLMIPSKLRRHLSDVLDFISATANTDNAFNFRDPFFLDKQAQTLGNNYFAIIETLRPFIVPTLAEQQQMTIIELYVNLRKKTDLDKIPEAVRQCSQRKTSVAFCHGEEETEHQTQQRIVEMIEGIVQSNSFTPQRKKKMLDQCRQDYPSIMNAFFNRRL